MESDQRHHTEKLYDEEISPLVKKILEIVKRENLPFLLSVGFIGPDGTGSTCTSAYVPSRTELNGLGLKALWGKANRIQMCYNIIYGHSGWDTASSVWITAHHPTDPEPDVPDVDDWIDGETDQHDSDGS